MQSGKTLKSIQRNHKSYLRLMPSAICDNTFFSVLIVLNLTERYYTAFLYVTTMGF